MGLEIGAALLFAGTVAAVGGTGYNAYAGAKAAKASRRAESLRQRQMNLDSAMKRREILRKVQLSRSQALSRTTQSGASSSSALGGAFGEIAQRGGEDVNYNEFSTDVGNDLFRANRDFTTWRSNAETGQGIANLGMNLIQSTPTLTSIGTEAFGKKPGSSTSPGYRGPYISSIY